MSKHSKWAKVKNQKGSVDAKRAHVFTKMAREITVAAREGADPEFNFKLRSAINRALAENLPKDNIERAIKKGVGDLASDRIEEVIYEGYAPGGLPVLIVALTDSRNRTAPVLRHLFSIHGGNFGASGSVQWMFEKVGMVYLDDEKISDEQELALIDAGAVDITRGEEGVEVRTAPSEVTHVRDAAEKVGLHISDVTLEWVAKEKAVGLSDDAIEKATALLAAIEDEDDVSEAYSNF